MIFFFKIICSVFKNTAKKLKFIIIYINKYIMDANKPKMDPEEIPKKIKPIWFIEV